MALEVVMPAQILEVQIIRRPIPVLRLEDPYRLHAYTPAGVPLQTPKVPFHRVASRIGISAEESWCPAPWPTQTLPTLVVMPSALSWTRHSCT